jgi:succinyl-CoA synthetase beta subunit
MGGIDIEEVAEQHPDHVARMHFSTLREFPSWRAKQLVASLGITGTPLNRLTPILTRLAHLFLEYDMTLAEINPLGELEDGSFIALDAHMDMENEARPRHKALLHELGVADEETRLLPQAERVLGERLGELGARMMKRRLALMAPHAGELTRHKARAVAKSNLLLAAGGLIAGVLLLRHVRRQA